MKRYPDQAIKKDANLKMILLSGPRQCGKTTLSKYIFDKIDYLNFDSSEDRERLFKKFWDRKAQAIIFDEIHKMKDWKRWIKGIYDTEGNKPHLLVTGSAQFDTFSKVGDSLAGRYFSYRLHPIDIKEGCIHWKNDPDDVLERLLKCSGFPEPFLNGEESFYRRWQKTHLDIILRQDFLDLYAIKHIKMLELLVDMLKIRVGSQISYSSVSRDIQTDHKTVKNWIQMLENIYAVFTVTPFHRNIARSILKEPKVYFYDVARVKDVGAQLENVVALSLLKSLHFLEDTEGYKGSLHYLKTKDGQEIDFCVCIDDEPVLMIEVKTSDAAPSSSFKIFNKHLPHVKKIQLVKNIDRPYSTQDGIDVCKLSNFLAEFDLKNYMNNPSLKLHAEHDKE